MLQQQSIRPGAPLKAEMDFFRLREEAISALHRLAGKEWTDYNIHDPGLTILEQLCYAMTDLGYRLNFSVPELLADALESGGGLGWKMGEVGDGNSLPAMPPAEAVLPSAPTTADDWRKAFLDLEGLRTSTLQPIDYGQGNLGFLEREDEVHYRKDDLGNLVPFRVAGLYELQVDVEEGRYSDVGQAIWERYHLQRPVGEDLLRIQQLRPVQLQLVGEMDLAPGTDLEACLAEAFWRLDRYVSPRAQFLSHAALKALGESEEDIYDGPLLKGGFVSREAARESAPNETVFLSQAIDLLLSVPGVRELRSVRLKGPSAQLQGNAGTQYWIAALQSGGVPRIDPEVTGLVVRVNGVKVPLDSSRVRNLYEVRRASTYGPLSDAPKAPIELPRNREVGKYQSLQHQFPEVYGISQLGLPAGSEGQRKAQAHQLKTWLLFFEQLLSDEFARAGQLGRYLQFREGTETQFARGDLGDVPEIEGSFLPLERLAQSVDDTVAVRSLRRLQRLLSHLVGRMGHEFGHFLGNGRPNTSEAQMLRQQVEGQLAMYKDLPKMARDRGVGNMLLSLGPQQAAVGGLKQRIARMLGLREQDPVAVPSGNIAEVLAGVDFIMVEHVLLRPIEADMKQDNMLFRFRSGKVTRVVRRRNKENPDDFAQYILQCVATGVETLKAGDHVEINFASKGVKATFPVLSVGETFFVIPNLYDIGSGSNPQGGAWNKVTTEGQTLYSDPWSLRLSYILHRHDLRFSEKHQRLQVEQMLRRESPAHLAVHAEWMDLLGMGQVAHHYAQFLVHFAAYIQDKAEGRHVGKRYVLLRHHRDALMRAIIPGETLPLRDFVIGVQAASGVQQRQLGNGDLELHASQAWAEPLLLTIEEPQPGIEYRLVKAGSGGNWEGYSLVGQAEGAPLALPATALDAQGGDFAILALDPEQQASALSFQKLKVIIG